MNHYMTALLLICATLMAQGQPAQLPVRAFDTRSRQELGQAETVQPLLRAQLRLLGSVDLHSLISLSANGADVCRLAVTRGPSRLVLFTDRADRIPVLLSTAPRRSRAP